jgi:hypothetical protein
MEHNQNTAGPLRITVGEHSLAGQPTTGDVMKLLIMLDDSEDGFLVMERGPEFFMRCSGTTSDGFAVAYRDGGDDRHFLSIDDCICLKEANDLFVSYLKEDNRWRKMILWEPVDGQDAGPARKSNRKRRGLIQRHGNTLVINKRWCMVALGLACFALGVTVFFVLSSITIHGGANFAGPLLGLGTVCLILSCFTGD